ncbi:hypothetical protein T484DRAFT_1854969 [Baffinella frigidus]|nr:hypothetical protein T484DRAFT_1854969 [Cryptophyta sp. CCMP2293]
MGGNVCMRRGGRWLSYGVNPWIALTIGTAFVLLWCVLAGLVACQFINFENGLVVSFAKNVLEFLGVLEVILFVALFRISGRTGRIGGIVYAACLTAFLWGSVEFIRDEEGQTLHLFWPPDFSPGARTLQRQTSPLLDTAPYILPCAQRLLNRSGSVAVRSAAARRLLGVDAIFVVHYPRLKERRVLMEKLLEREGLHADVNWVTFQEDDSYSQEERCHTLGPAGMSLTTRITPSRVCKRV